ncbi:unnamed protein product [Symbiodinium necroappetens]|uniref:Uncharacterized protein n=1 Tax=Symbiodinium necroappetens TaxID=1628268 RepID=A0A813ANA7_9DINO|nr:unnamed protein product [Symbiodinium necroappetens]
MDDDEKVTLGEATRAPFAAIKAAGADGNVVRPVKLLGPEQQNHGQGILEQALLLPHRLLSPGELVPSVDIERQFKAGLGAQLRAAVAKQEEQVRLLEALVQRKGEQQQQLQAHLEGLLERLDLGPCLSSSSNYSAEGGGSPLAS